METLVTIIFFCSTLLLSVILYLRYNYVASGKKQYDNLRGRIRVYRFEIPLALWAVSLLWLIVSYAY